MGPEKISYDDVPPASREAVHAAKNAAQLLEVARQQQIENLGDIVQARFEHVLSLGTESERAIILARVPYICQDIKEINVSLAQIISRMEAVKNDLIAKDEKNEKKYVTQEQFAPYKWVLSIIGSVVIATIVGALLAKILIP